MNRRAFLQTAAATGLLAWIPQHSWAAANYQKLLILVELKGGNDGLNTVIPYADAQYAALRPRLAVVRDQVLQLDDSSGLNPALAPLMPLWKAGEVAVVQGVGYPTPNLSHFRSIEIWDTASKSNEFLQDGWLTRAFAQAPVPRSYAADAVVVGSAEMGPFSGSGTRTIALTNTEQFLQQAKLAVAAGQAHN
ncbi:MAG: Twin-arginine translocation pathway signal sequence domain-containing protein, partial [Burkholderiales bacterium]